MNDERRLEIFQLQAELCKSLADAKRIMVVHELREGEKSVGELADSIGISQSNMSQHIAQLKKLDIVIPRRQGSSVYYSLASPKIAEACDMIRQVLMDRFEGNRELARDIRSL